MDQGLQVFPYPTDTSNLDNDEVFTSPPVGVSVTLPDSIVFLESPRVARWDDAGRADMFNGESLLYNGESQKQQTNLEKVFVI